MTEVSLALRKKMADWKLVYWEGPGRANVKRRFWQNPLVKMRIPHIFSLRTRIPFRARPISNSTFYCGLGDRISFLLYGGQAVVAARIRTKYVKYPTAPKRLFNLYSCAGWSKFKRRHFKAHKRQKVQRESKVPQ